MNAKLYLTLAMTIVLVGCENNAVVDPPPNEPTEVTADAGQGTTDGDNSGTQPVAVVEQEPQPADIWAEKLAELTALLEKEELEAAAKCIEEFAAIYEPPEKPGDEQTTGLAALQAQLEDKLAARAALQREEKLTLAQKALEESRLEEAIQAIGDVLANNPTAEQRQTASRISLEVERLRKARRELLTWMQLLGSKTPGEVATAQTQLSRDPETAMSLLLEAARKTDQPVLVANALELMRLLNQPARSVPAMIGVLKNSEQKENWPDAIRQLSMIDGPGAGALLLDLAVEAEEPSQRKAALTALASVVDPPEQTLVAVLPFIMNDGPELPEALSVAWHSANSHGQFDLTSRRGFDTTLTGEQEQALDELPERLNQIIAGSAKDEAAAETAHRAKVLACAMRLVEATVLPDVKLARAGAESEEGPAAAVLDGVWNSVEPKTMWRHPINQRANIELDLGAEKTVTGVRIWNFNEPAAGHRGWKDVDVFVGNSPTDLVHVGRGIVPMAPGVADTPDYSTVVPIEFARGRYVRLVAKNQWRADVHTGLAEIQVIGF